MAAAEARAEAVVRAGAEAAEPVVVTKAVGVEVAEGTAEAMACEAHERHEQNEHSRRGAPCLKTLWVFVCKDWDG